MHRQVSSSFLIHHEVSFLYICVCVCVYTAHIPNKLYTCKDNFWKLKKAPQRPDNMGVVLYWYHSVLLFIYIIHPFIVCIRIHTHTQQISLSCKMCMCESVCLLNFHINAYTNTQIIIKWVSTLKIASMHSSFPPYK